jgi:hypothetical protein
LQWHGPTENFSACAERIGAAPVLVRAQKASTARG